VNCTIFCPNCRPGIYALFAFLSIWIAVYSFLYEGAPFVTLAANPYLPISTFLPSILMGMLITSIGEELAWRGFALPRLQFRYNTLTSSLIVGTFWTLYYLPLFFTLTGSSQANISFIGFTLSTLSLFFTMRSSSGSAPA